MTKPPARPTAADDGEDVGEIVFGLKEMQFDHSEDWDRVGYDLDNLCSFPPYPTVECDPPAAAATAEVDGAGGVDNAVSHLLVRLAFAGDTGSYNMSLQDYVYMLQQHGLGVVLLRVRGYNGMASDSKVDVDFTLSAFGTPGLADGGVPIVEQPDGGVIDVFDPSGFPVDGAVPGYPEWQGNDYFWAREYEFFGGDPQKPIVRNDNAYVSDWTLVVRIPDRVLISFPGSTMHGLAARFTDATLTVRMSHDYNQVEAATFAGRWSVADLLETMEYQSICAGSTYYELMHTILDYAADVRATPGTGGPGTTCDALSTGITFTGMRVKWGGVTPFWQLQNPCESP